MSFVTYPLLVLLYRNFVKHSYMTNSQEYIVEI